MPCLPLRALRLSRSRWRELKINIPSIADQHATASWHVDVVAEKAFPTFLMQRLLDCFSHGGYLVLQYFVLVCDFLVFV